MEITESTTLTPYHKKTSLVLVKFVLPRESAASNFSVSVCLPYGLVIRDIYHKVGLPYKFIVSSLAEPDPLGRHCEASGGEIQY